MTNRKLKQIILKLAGVKSFDSEGGALRLRLEELIHLPGGRGLRRFLRRSFPLTLAIIFLLGPAIYLLTTNPKKAGAGWFNDSWGYRQKVEITNAGSAQTDFQVAITLNTSTLITASKMQSDCDDIRVTDINGKLLPYWIETGTNACNTATTAIWTKVPSIPTSGATVYLYYGNPSASSYQDGNKVFEFFEDFNNSTIDSSKWTTSGTVTQSGGNISIGSASKLRSIQNFGYKSSDFRMQTSTGDGSNRLEAAGFRDSTDTNNAILYTSNATVTNIYSGTKASGSWSANSVHTVTDRTAMQVYRVNRYSAAGVKFYQNTTQLVDDTTNIPTANLELEWSNANTVTTTLDWVFVRSTAATEPTIASPANEEKSPGPVAYWSFDDGYGTVAQDKTLNNNDGTISGATWQTEDMCVNGKCLYFDGTNDVVTVSNTVSGIQTISFWIKPITTSEQFIDLNGSAYIQVSSGTISATGFTDPTIYVNGNPSTTLRANSWQYVTVTTGTAISGSAIKIGQISTNYGQAFIDEVKIYNYARSASQILTDYNARGDSHGSSAKIGNESAWITNGLVGYWKMDESSGNAADSSGNGVTLTNNGTTTFVGGKFGNGSEHVPASTQYFSTATTISGVKTVSFWVNPDSNTNYYIDLNGSAYINSSSGTIAATGFTNPIIYVNGQVSSIISADTWSLVTVTTETAISASAFNVGKISTNYFDGTLDDVRIYNRALSPAEVSQLYNWAPGPVIYYAFEEGSGTAVNDKSGNGINATLATGTSIISGKYGKAISVAERTNKGFTSSTNSLLNVSQYTLEFWVRFTAAADGQFNYIVGKQDRTPGVWTYNTIAGHCLYWRQNPGDTGSSCAGPNGNSTYFNLNQWYHVAGTYDGSLKIYIDGKYKNTYSIANPLASNNGPVYSAASDNAPVDLDEAKFYNYARTAEQIKADMLGRTTQGGSALGVMMAGPRDEYTPVAHWRFDEGYGTTSQDSGSNNQDLTLVNTPTWNNNGKLNKALDFEKDSSEYGYAADSATLSLTSSLTISAWIKPESVTASTLFDIAGKWDGTNESYLLAQYGDEIRMYVDASANYKTTDAANLATGTWYHVTAVYDATAQTVTLYINGVPTAGTTSGTIPSSIGDDDGRFQVGAEDSTTTAANFYDGLIDEPKVYNFALTSDQVKIDYNAGSAIRSGYSQGDDPDTGLEASLAGNPPVGEWSFDEGSGVTANDRSGNGNTGTWNGTGTTHWAVGKIGKAGNFNGSDDRVVITLGSAITGSVTEEAWIYMATDNGPWKDIVGTYPADSSYSELRFCGTNSVCFTYNNHNDVSVTITKNAWHHVVGVYDGTYGILYIDGINKGSYSAGSAHSFSTINLGSRTNNTEFFNGLIDHVKIYNYARSQAQIAYDYNRGGPVGYWKFDECQGGTAYDASGNSNNGTITIGATGTQDGIGTCTDGDTTNARYNGVTGKRNSSLNFDGTDDYVNVPHSASLNINNAISVEAWVKTTASGPRGIVEKRDAATLKGFWFRQYSDNKAQLYLNGGSGIAIYGYTSSVINDGQWHHIVGVGTFTDLHMYFDGVDKTTGLTQQGTITDITNTEPLTIGETLGTYFNGQIDEPKIYNYALSATQIKKAYNEGAVRFGPSTGSP